MILIMIVSMSSFTIAISERRKTATEMTMMDLTTQEQVVLLETDSHYEAYK